MSGAAPPGRSLITALFSPTRDSEDPGVSKFGLWGSLRELHRGYEVSTGEECSDTGSSQ